MAARDRFVNAGYHRVLDQVGEGHLVGKLTVDQVYAKYHHERLDLHHPRGGGPKYLEAPLFANSSDYWQRIAASILDGDPEEAMKWVVEALNSAMSSRAPIQFNNLRRSGNPRVYSNGRLVYDRAAWQHRLTREELRLLRQRRRLP